MDPSGRPVAGGYVIGLRSLTVARTDASGRYAMACQGEPLLAATWLVQVTKPGPFPGGIRFGIDSTEPTAVPSDPGPGYVFSGGAGDLARAAPVACNGHEANFTLVAGGSVTIAFVDAAGQPFLAAQSAVPPIDNLYLPGLGAQANLATAPVDAAGHQVLAQLGPGVLRIDGTSSHLSCSGPGVGPDPSVGGATEDVVAGQAVTVTCQVG